MTTIYSELLAAAGTEFLPQAEGEPDGHYLRRLVLAVSKASDTSWDSMATKAKDWYNTQAIRVKAHQDPEYCPGFINPIVDAVVDAGWPITVNNSPEGFSVSGTTVILDKPIVASDIDQDSPHTLTPAEQSAVVEETESVLKDSWNFTKHTATDAVRALVMLHQYWNQSQIAAELEAHGQPVSIGTIATVRSMTLATIAVAKGLGKWVEG